MSQQLFDLKQLQSAILQAGATWVAGETPLTELSPQEKRLRLGAEPPPSETSFDEREQTARTRFQAGVEMKAIGAPAFYDLRNVDGKNFITAVKHQRNCGSCVAFGSIATVEGTLRVQQNNAELAADLSEAHLFYGHAAAQGRNCNNGWWVDPALDVFKNIGVADEPCFPYMPGDQACVLCSDWQKRVTKITGWRKLATAAEMKTWLSTKGPLAACFKVYDDFYAYTSGVYRHVSGDFLGGHCVCVVGYSDTDSCWICKNSWGANWGENGFFRIAYGDCGIDYIMWGVEVAAQTGNWLEKKLITGLWTVNSERKASAYIDGVGWRGIAADSDIGFLAILTLLAAAKTSKAQVNVRVVNDVIQEVYLF